jgi:predicted dehydrogenase
MLLGRAGPVVASGHHGRGRLQKGDNMHQIGVAVVGAGYWGPNLVRNVAMNPDTELRWVCDVAFERADALASRYAGATATTSLEHVLADRAVDAVLIATPASTHAELAIACLRAGKHVLIEKPLAASVVEAERMLAVARQANRVLMCDHTYCYTPAAQFISRLVGNGELGDILFVDSVRINLGLVQRDVNVIWDLAPHDLSILDFVLPAERAVQTVAAQAADPLGVGQACVGYLTLGLAGGSIGHVHVNWLSPTKVRTMIIGGSRRTLVWDDLNPTQRVCVYDRGVDVDIVTDPEMRHRNKVAYRIGDMVAPALRDTEALSGVINELVAGVRGERVPRTDARAGLSVLKILEAASTSLELNGATVPVGAAMAVAT